MVVLYRDNRDPYWSAWWNRRKDKRHELGNGADISASNEDEGGCRVIDALSVARSAAKSVDDRSGEQDARHVG